MQGVENLFVRQDRMAALNPTFCDITWGAGGTTADLTLQIATKMQNTVSDRQQMFEWRAILLQNAIPTKIYLPCQALQTLDLTFVQICVETMMHLTCTNMPKEELKKALDQVMIPSFILPAAACGSQD